MKKSKRQPSKLKPTIRFIDEDQERRTRKLNELMGVVSDEKLEQREQTRKKIKKFLDRPLAPKKGRRLTRLGKGMRVSAQKGIAGFFR